MWTELEYNRIALHYLTICYTFKRKIFEIRKYCTSGNYIFVTLTWTPEACNCFRISVSVFKNKIIKTFKFLKRLWGFFLYQVLIFSCRVVDIKIETMTYCQISIFEKVHWIFLDLFYVEESFSIIIISIHN
jgi:hypothetical protein